MKNYKGLQIFSFSFLLSLATASSSLSANEKGLLYLSARVNSSMNSRVISSEIKDDVQSYVLVTESNFIRHGEAQKVEVENLNQIKDSVEFKKIGTSGNVSNYSLTVKRSFKNSKNYFPVILKISAN